MAELQIEDLLSVLEETSPTSKLGQWLTTHRVEFERAVQSARPRWEALAMKFAEADLIKVSQEFWDADDTPGRRMARHRAAEAVRQVWVRVNARGRRTKRVDRDARAVGRQPVAQAVPAPPQAQQSPSAPAAPTPGRRYTFKPSSLRYSSTEEQVELRPPLPSKAPR